MLLDVSFAIDSNPLPVAAEVARAAEEIGFDALWTPETGHNGFMPLALAAEHTSRISIGTAVAIAFPRSPMVTAQIAWDLAAFSGGRFILGLGTQVKAHIERRFSTPWDAPVGRLHDYILALRAIWQSWQSGERLNYRGKFYQHTLMTPFFSPGPIAHPDIPIYIAGVNSGLAQLAGELCDGFHAHPLNSAKYTTEVLRPQIAAGAAKSGRDPAACAVAGSAFVITGPDAATREHVRGFVRQQISFYGSTPSYRPVLDCHGWGEVGEQLSQLAAQQRWAEMPALVTPEMEDAFAIEADPADVGPALLARYGGLLDRVGLYIPFVPGQMDGFWRKLAADLRA
ncbi:TIGR03617 family F420-dependent LLM class oxidoreductase [Oscillochloris sp. ZM17-4]|uniref:TIGR03617 family F420-dependent LLM class oxidoreductase n=1 Tax=Oscillochloris sp. ZM17-4 TaxID=2866714 RepID=UPI001C73BA38|nr:TIGR03617 family F420-dependent LLM class oxidoreductase [Oscillochloris sp. ZM17-4]MBX0327665.1 TIGR03617 family F420-dependent LLM class oxidoreductase [Oscillochloris sp. ZM17-4]